MALLGRLSSGADAASIVRTPRRRPAPPVPARARPTMNKSDEFARAQIREPISNNARATRKTFCDYFSALLNGYGEGGGLWSCSIDISSRIEVVRRLWEMLED